MFWSRNFLLKCCLPWIRFRGCSFEHVAFAAKPSSFLTLTLTFAFTFFKNQKLSNTEKRISVDRKHWKRQKTEKISFYFKISWKYFPHDDQTILKNSIKMLKKEKFIATIFILKLGRVHWTDFLKFLIRFVQVVLRDTVKSNKSVRCKTGISFSKNFLK